MQGWTAAELVRFLAWAEARDPDLAMAWRVLAATGMRCGEALALRWRDVDLQVGPLQVRRSVGVVRNKGAGQQLVEGPTMTGQARLVDIDPDTIAALEAYRAQRARLAPELAGGAALVLGDLDGGHRHPERFPCCSAEQVAQARASLGEETLPRIRLHDLRHPTPRSCWPLVSR
jgi:integrase